MDRRDFLKTSALGVAGLQLGWTWTPAMNFQPASSPHAIVGGKFDSDRFGGDEFEHPHEALRTIDTYLARHRAWENANTEEKIRDTLILGGGLSGLLSAYMLRDKDWLLFEQASRFGGNTKSEEFGDTRFGLGPAYICAPETGSAIHRLLTELGILQYGRLEKAEGLRVLLGGIRDLGKGETDPAASASFTRLKAALQKAFEKEYPDIPWKPGGHLSFDQLAALDRMSALDWLKSLGPLHPHVHEYAQLYAWSSMGGSLEEVSAAQFINFAAGEVGGVLAFPGGNAFLTSALHASLEKTAADRLRDRTLVLDVRLRDAGVECLVERAPGQFVIHRAKSLVVSLPKYVARNTLRKYLDRDRARLWDEIESRAFLVANVLLDRDVSPASFDLYCLEGKAPEPPTFGSRSDRPFTDLIFAGWAQTRGSQGPKTSVLTLYRPFPFAGARNLLLHAQLERVKADLNAHLARRLPELGIPSSGIRGMRVTLWGHALPLPKIGKIADGSIQKNSAPLGSRIFFACQDDALNPAFESCFASAERASASVRAL